MVKNPFWYKKYKHINCLKASINCSLGVVYWGNIEWIFRRPVKYSTDVGTAPQMLTREFWENISKHWAAASDI